jgi:co-chaperonin GroES (HSP10)
MTKTAAVPLYKGAQAEYVPATYQGRNTSGLKPYGKNVLVRVDECATATTGGVKLLDEYVERMTANATSGCIYYLAPEAFRLFDDGTPWIGEAPKVGDRICFEKYAGQIQTGVDGHPYRIMDYRNIACSLDYDYLEEIGVEAAA